jgi:Zn-dependent peptidase ImmA (M78 family)
VRIRYVKGPLLLGDTPCNGQYDHDRREILVDRSLPDDAAARVIWHEYAHALLLDRDLVIPDDQLEEAICNAVADALLAQVGAPVGQ